MTCGPDGRAYPALEISIHTALAGCDIGKGVEDMPISIFQSTQPSQAVTGPVGHKPVRTDISIHTALAGCDLPLAGNG